MRLFIATAIAAAVFEAGAQVPPRPPAPPTPPPTPRAAPPAPPVPGIAPTPAPWPGFPGQSAEWREHERAMREIEREWQTRQRELEREWQVQQRELERSWDAELRANQLRVERELRALELEQRARERELRATPEAMEFGRPWPQPTPMPPLPPTPFPPLTPPLPPTPRDPPTAPTPPAPPPSLDYELARERAPLTPPPFGWSASADRPPESWLPQDPGDSVYNAARLMYNRNQYRSAAESFRALRQRFPTSGYVADALLWEARALYQIGGQYELQTARDLLNERRQKFPNAPTTDPGFETRVIGALADRGDPTARQQVMREASGRPGVAPEGRGGRQGSGQDPNCDRNAMAIRIEALNAISRMAADSTTPIIRRVLANRDACSERLRMQAIMVLSKNTDAATTDILIDVIRNDPSIDVKRQAVSWLGEVPSERGIAALEEILRSPQDAALHAAALRAIANTRNPRAAQVIRSTIERADASDELRRDAIANLIRVDSTGAGTYLRGIYPRLQGMSLREAALTSIARIGGDDNRRWLTEFVRNPAEPVALRQSVLRALTRSRETPMAMITALYSAVPELELKTQIISSLGGRREPEAVDELIKMYRATNDTKLQLQIVNALASRRDDPKARQFLIDILK